MALSIARDEAAADHLVHGWSLGTVADDIEITCADDEVVVLCPAWAVGERLGPGTHRWRNPDLSRPAAAYFVLTSPVEVPFALVTRFMLPATRAPVQLRASGSVMVRAADAGVLVAQFVGLPFDDLNGGLLRSVAASVERITARLLTHRVIELGDVEAATHPTAIGALVDDLIGYGPTAGAVFGLELTRFLGLDVVADALEPSGAPAGARRSRTGPTVQGWAGGPSATAPTLPPASVWAPDATAPATPTPVPPGFAITDVGAALPRSTPRAATVPSTAPPSVPPPTPAPRRSSSDAIPIEVAEMATPPAGISTVGVVSGVIGIGMGRIGEASGAALVVPRPTTPVAVDGAFPRGAPVLVAGADGRLVSATVRDRQAGYYQLEIGGSGEIVWVPEAKVVAEPG